ncbi:MAG: cupin domain-containing protein [Smithella sp.]
MFYKANQGGYKIVLPGIKLKTLVYGEKTLFTEFRMDAGSVLPRHAHIHEQTGYLIEGNIRLRIDEQVFEVEKGDCWSIPGNMEHSAEILKDSVAIEVFSPVRDEYIPRKVK